jgi:protein TonB
MKRERLIVTVLRETVHRVLVVTGAVVLAVGLFLTLPLLQAITQPPEADLVVRAVDSADLPPPPPPPPEEEKKEEEKQEEEPEPPKLMEESAPLDLSQLELALDLGMGGGADGIGDFGVKITTAMAATAQASNSTADDLVSLSDLDQEPRLVHSPGPSMNDGLRKKAPGKVVVIFIVDTSGRVENPTVQSATDPAFERPALQAIKQWRFEPGKRKGQPVRFRMRQSITFPKSG